MIGPAFDQVLAAAQAGAGWAFTRLYESLAPTVVGYLRARGVNEPEDVASEVFLGVFTNLATFTGNEEQWRSWVFTIAYRRMADHLRSESRRGRHQAQDELDGHHGVVPTSPGPEGEALARLGAERVQRILAELAPDQADVLALRVIADLSVDQVAAALDKSPGAVKALQRRALAILRRRFSAEGVPR
jgi:RNA polymerase sigma factor (sigma-70 family)